MRTLIRNILAILGSVAIIAGSFSPVSAAQTSMPLEISVQKLAETGEIEVVFIATLNASAPLVEESLRHFEDFPQFIPSLIASDVRKKEDNRTLVYNEFKLPWPVGNVWAETWFHSFKEDPKGQRSTWKSERGNVLGVRGEFFVRPMQEKSSFTQVTRVQLSPWIPLWIMDWATDYIVPLYVERLNEYAKRQSAKPPKDPAP